MMIPVNAPPSAVDTRRHIAEVLGRFLKGHRIRKIFTAADSIAPPPMAFVVRFPRLAVTLSGLDESEVVLNGRSEIVQAGSGNAMFIPPNAWNRPTWQQRARVLHFLFGKQHMGMSLVQQEGGSIEPCATRKIGIHCTISDPLHQMLNAFSQFSPAQQDSPAGRLLIEAILHTCAALLQESESRRGNKGRDTYDRICLYVHAHFHRSITRESVAHHFRLSPSHVSRLFHIEGNVGFNEFLVSCRIQHAKQLLRDIQPSIDEISCSCGFADTAYFCRVFKKNMRLTPSAYRQQVQSMPATQ